jgi:hypothetical protein
MSMPNFRIHCEFRSVRAGEAVLLKDNVVIRAATAKGARRILQGRGDAACKKSDTAQTFHIISVTRALDSEHGF